MLKQIVCTVLAEKNEVYRTDQTKHHNTLIANSAIGGFYASWWGGESVSKREIWPD